MRIFPHQQKRNDNGIGKPYRQGLKPRSMYPFRTEHLGEIMG